MTENDEMKWLYGLGMHRMKLGLENITVLMNKLGNPQNEYKTVHVAGSDGKGSSSAMIHSILMENGFKTGLYTSPHIVRFNERIRVGDSEITNDELAHYISIVKPMTEEMKERNLKCTFFEVVTAIAFLYFRDKKVDYAVIEVGLGGRFDATNIIFPEVSAITNVSMEHKDVLGNTLDKIAYEKCGIIKKFVPVVTSNIGIPLEVIERSSKENNSRLRKISEIEILSQDRKSVGMRYENEDYVIGIPGDYQAYNAAIAIETAKILKLKNIKEGLRKVRWKYRMEYVDNKNMIVDVSHTADGSKALCQNIKKLYGKVNIVLGMLDDKDANNFVKNISEIAEKIFVVKPDSERALPAETLWEVAKKEIPGAVLCSSFEEAMDKAFETGGETLVTGSFYMAMAADRWLKVNRWRKATLHGFWTNCRKNTPAERILEDLPKD